MKMLATRLDQLVKVEADDTDCRRTTAPPSIRSATMEVGVETDNAPTQVMEQEDWTDHQRRQLRNFSTRLEGLRRHRR